MIISPDLRSAFAGLRVLELKMEGVMVNGSDPALELFKREVQERIRQRTRSLEDVKHQPVFRAYRDFFWRVGIDPTKIRPAGEALTRRILGGRDLPRVNTLVDAYNLASVETSVAIAALELAGIIFPITEDNRRLAPCGIRRANSMPSSSISSDGVSVWMDPTRSPR